MENKGCLFDVVLRRWCLDAPAQADIHNFLAQLALDAGDRKVALRHAEIGREWAWYDGPPYCYKPALDEAERLLEELRMKNSQWRGELRMKYGK